MGTAAGFPSFLVPSCPGRIQIYGKHREKYQGQKVIPAPPPDALLCAVCEMAKETPESCPTLLIMYRHSLEWEEGRRKEPREKEPSKC